MYHYIENKSFLKNMRRCASDIINQLVQKINKEDFLMVKAQLVGSGAKNLETQNGNEPVDLDYNLNIIDCSDINNCYAIKEYVRKEFNKILANNGLGDCSDSKSVLTTGQMRLDGEIFSIDLAIVCENKNRWYRLIHNKTGIITCDSWIWNESKNSNDLTLKVRQLKEDNLWNELRDVYLDKKNMYLRRNDYNHPSFICYIEAVNEIYNHYYS